MTKMFMAQVQKEDDESDRKIIAVPCLDSKKIRGRIFCLHRRGGVKNGELVEEKEGYLISDLNTGTSVLHGDSILEAWGILHIATGLPNNEDWEDIWSRIEEKWGIVNNAEGWE